MALEHPCLPVVTASGLDFGNYVTGLILTEITSPGPASADLSSPRSTGVTSPRYTRGLVLINLLTDVLYAKAGLPVSYE
jgi:hypothetical protein